MASTRSLSFVFKVTSMGVMSTQQGWKGFLNVGKGREFCSGFRHFLHPLPCQPQTYTPPTLNYASTTPSSPVCLQAGLPGTRQDTGNEIDDIIVAAIVSLELPPSRRDCLVSPTDAKALFLSFLQLASRLRQAIAPRRFVTV